MISELLGLPLADRPRFIAWANTMSSLTNVASFFRLLFAFRKMRAYLERQLQIARVRGGEGLIAGGPNRVAVPRGVRGNIQI